MKEIKYEPECCKTADAKVKGYLVLVVPSYPQRMKYLGQIGYKVKDGKIDFSEGDDQLNAMIQSLEIAKAHYKEIHLEKADGVKIESYEDLEVDPDCEAVMNEVAAQVLQGFRPSPNSKAS